MTNTEGPENFSSDSATEVDAPEATGPVFTAPTFDGVWDQAANAYRYLTWVHKTASRAYSVDLAGFSPERQAGVADLVRNGLVSEARWSGGEHDGRVSYRLTELGVARLDAARAAAALVVVG